MGSLEPREDQILTAIHNMTENETDFTLPSKPRTSNSGQWTLRRRSQSNLQLVITPCHLQMEGRETTQGICHCSSHKTGLPCCASSPHYYYVHFLHRQTPKGHPSASSHELCERAACCTASCPRTQCVFCCGCWEEFEGLHGHQTLPKWSFPL